MSWNLQLAGQKFGKLLVLKRVKNHNKYRKNGEKAFFWKCLCDCGNKTVARSADLRRGKKRSCGCLIAETAKTTNLGKYYAFKGEGICGLNCLIRSYKNSAKTRGLIYELTNEQVKFLTKKNCRICGIEPCGVFKDKNWPEKSWYTYNGIDRIDNIKGYVFKNCGTMCKTCNRAKLDLTEEEFQNWIKRVIKNNSK